MSFVLAHPKSKVVFTGSPIVHRLKGVHIDVDGGDLIFETRCGVEASNGESAFTPASCGKCKPNKDDNADNSSAEGPSNT